MTGITNQLDQLYRKLGANLARHQVASQNIANVNTPGFKANEVANFTESLEGTNPTSRTVYSVRKQDGKARLDGNNVDIDKELGQLKKSALQHKAFTQLLATRLRQLKSAMSNR